MERAVNKQADKTEDELMRLTILFRQLWRKRNKCTFIRRLLRLTVIDLRKLDQ